MSPLLVKRLYLLSLLFTAIAVYAAHILFGKNVFPEAGAVLIVIAIVRGFIPLTKQARGDYAAAADAGELSTLRTDIYIVIVGTLLNGFSNLMYFLLKASLTLT